MVLNIIVYYLNNWLAQFFFPFRAKMIDRGVVKKKKNFCQDAPNGVYISVKSYGEMDFFIILFAF